MAFRAGFVWLAFAGCAFHSLARATSIRDDRPLAEVIAQSDYVICGKVRGVGAIDGHGREVVRGDPSSGPGSEVQLVVDVNVPPDGVLKSKGPPPVSPLRIFCWQMLILDLDGMRPLVGKQFVFLLVKRNGRLQGAHAGFAGAGMQFMSELPEIRGCLPPPVDPPQVVNSKTVPAPRK